jgi:hypothetical protein
MSPAVFYSSDY